MFVVMADVRVGAGNGEAFERWFEESNGVLSGMPGFVSRKLFRSNDGSSSSGYRIMMIHESKSTFVAMHNSPEHARAFAEGRRLMESDPVRQTFSEV